MTDVITCKCLIGGKWTDARTERFLDVWNPCTGEVIARTPLCGAEDVDRAVEAAQAAFPSWRDTPATDRARVLFRFHALLQQHAEEIAQTCTREHGKTLAESRASVQRGVEMIEFACGMPSLLMGDNLKDIAPDVDSETTRYPLGVVAGITPFNFPAMVPLWMYPPAIACGNCFVLKPSERVPLSSIRIAELLLEAGLPPGVFSIVHGDKTCVDALLANPNIKAISFVGSTPVARHVYQTGAANGKRVQAAGGAKNHLVIMPDADLDATVRGMLHSAFGCAGERCMAGSLAVPVGDVADKLIKRFAAAAAKMKVGRTDVPGSQAEMGPLISKKHLDRVRGYIDTAEREGARIVLDGRNVAQPPSAVDVAQPPSAVDVAQPSSAVDVAQPPSAVDVAQASRLCRHRRDGGATEGFFLGPTIIDGVTPEMTVAREEVFGPVLPFIRVKTLDEAIALSHRSPYANGGVIFTDSGLAARRFKHEFNAGMIGVNIGVPAPMAWFPFTGWKNSFFGDLHIQGKEGMLFYTQQRMTMTRWFKPAAVDAHDPVWRPGRK